MTRVHAKGATYAKWARYRGTVTAASSKFQCSDV